MCNHGLAGPPLSPALPTAAPGTPARPAAPEHQHGEDEALDPQDLHIIKCLGFRNKRACWEVYV